jgi:hypothetical protein
MEARVMTADKGKVEGNLAEAQSARLAWETPETVEVDLGRAETANQYSNFDGTNYSS